MRAGHFMPFHKLKGRNTEEKHCPSLNSKAVRRASKAPPGMLFWQRLRTTVTCGECGKPRGIYSQVQLTSAEKEQLSTLMELVD